MEEKRQQIRINKSVTVTYEILGNFLGSSTPSKNISEGGIRLAVYQYLEPQMFLKLWIHIEDLKEPIVAMGQVVWLERREDRKYPYEIGIKFTRIAESNRIQLCNYIRRLSGEGKTDKISWSE